MLKTESLVIVEGKYDKIRLEGILDAFIITTDGFGIFKDRDKIEFIKSYAGKNGALIITDSDSAGFTIRKFLNDILPEDKIYNVFLPDIYGREKRKKVTSKDGKIELDGMISEVIVTALKNSGFNFQTDSQSDTSREITPYTLYELGLSGTEDSSKRLAKLTETLSLPERISKNSLLKYLNMNYTDEQLRDIVKKI